MTFSAWENNDELCELRYNYRDEIYKDSYPWPEDVAAKLISEIKADGIDCLSSELIYALHNFYLNDGFVVNFEDINEVEVHQEKTLNGSGYIWAELLLMDYYSLQEEQSRNLEFLLPLSDLPDRFKPLVSNYYISVKAPSGLYAVGEGYADDLPTKETFFSSLEEQAAFRLKDECYVRDYSLRKSYSNTYKEAYRNILNSNDYAIKDAKEILDNLLIINSYEDSKTQPDQPYRHMLTATEQHLPHHKIGALVAERNALFPLKENYQEYIQADWLRSEHLDWLCADQMIYKQYGQLASWLYTARLGVSGILIEWLQQTYKFPSWLGNVFKYFLKTLFFILGWGLTIGGIYFVHNTVSSTLGYLLVLGVVIWMVTNFKRRKKALKIMDGLRYAYSLVDSKKVPWKTQEQKLRTLIDEGLPIENELMLIVERNSKL